VVVLSVWIAPSWSLASSKKEVISDEATVGIYNFRRGLDFVRAGPTR